MFVSPRRQCMRWITTSRLSLCVHKYVCVCVCVCVGVRVSTRRLCIVSLSLSLLFLCWMFIVYTHTHTHIHSNTHTHTPVWHRLHALICLYTLYLSSWSFSLAHVFICIIDLFWQGVEAGAVTAYDFFFYCYFYRYWWSWSLIYLRFLVLK